MVEEFAISLATEATKGLVKLVTDRLSNEINLAWGFKDKLRKLNKKFEYVQAFLDDAGNTQYKQQSEQVKKWVQKVKDAAYEADNVMDEYAIEIFRRKMELKNQFTKKFRNFFTPSNPVFFYYRMSDKVDEILSLFDEIDKDARNIGLNRVDIPSHGSANDYILDETRQYASADGSKFVGREDVQDKLLQFICSPSNHDLPTVAIYGMGGVGKTTLARRVYSHSKICDHFGDNTRIWISVSENFTITKILNEMVESVTLKKSDLSNNDAIIGILRDALKGKKYLLVLDDVWNENQSLWVSLRDLLNTIGSAPGSVILVTTRSDEVAKAAEAGLKHKLKGLSNYDSWVLFNRIVSNNNTQQISSSLMEIGQRILDKCNGIPLAIKVLGSLLQSNQNSSEWESIEQSEIWNLPSDKSQILPSLWLSFNRLPSPSLKQCFAYCAVITKGHYVYKTELIGLWLSQGYLRTDGRTNMTMEEIGEKNLKTLLSNSLVEEFPSVHTGIMVYKMHDLVYDLAVHVCGSDLIKKANNLLEIVTCRHLVVFKSVENITPSDVPPTKETLSKLRTLSLKGTFIQCNMLSHAKYLRTLKLDLSGITELPTEVVRLKHLRFLDVSYNQISILPDFLSQLYQLQTLILYGCINIKKLPRGLNKLVNLRHILTTTSMLACKGLQQLTNLQTLPALCLNDDVEGWSIDELGDLHQLRDEIQIQGLEFVNDKEQARKAGLGRKAKVTKLNLSWAGGRGETSEGNCDEDVLEGLEPHPNITSLEVQNFGGVRFPTWITVMSVLTEGRRHNRKLLDNLTMVKLLNCNRCQTLPKLGHLPLLKYLILSGLNVECIGMEFYDGDDLGTQRVESFKCLTELEISGFRRLVTWIDPPEAAFPCLETLRVKDCDKLKSVPALGIKSISGLELEDLPHMESLDIIKYSSGLGYVNDKEKARKDGLVRKVDVTKQNFSCDEGRGETSEGNCDEDVLEGLEPHPNTTSLEVQNFDGVRFPTRITGTSVLTEGQRDNRTRLDNLTKVKLINCNVCQTLPKLGLLPVLKCLILRGLNVECIGIEFYGGDDLGMQGVESFKCLTELEISEFRRLVRWIDPPEAAFPCLETLRVKDCDQLNSVPALGIKSLSALELERLHSVESLDIIKYSSGLTSLKMDMLPKVESLPQELANCKQLQVIKISYLEKLRLFPSGLESLINLQSMRVAHCPALSFIMDDLRQVSSYLWNFQIVYCPSLKKIPSSLEECISLETLSILKCPMVESSPINISKMQHLWEFRISCCSVENLRSVLESARDLPLLRRLEIEGFKDDNEMSDYFFNMTPFLNLTHLTELILLGGPNIKTLPQKLLQFTRITALYLFYFEDLEEIPYWIFELPSLVSLYLDKCYNLKYLASKEDMERLHTLRINGCPYLEESYAKDVGSEWHTISHIMTIIINDVEQSCSL